MATRMTPRRWGDPPSEEIVAEGLVREFISGKNCVRAIENISLKVNKGEYVAITGPSGSGKTTLLNILGCLDRPSRGRYWIEGLEVTALKDQDLSFIRASRIGFVFQAFNLIEKCSVAQNIVLPLKHAQISRREREILVVEAILKVGLTPNLLDRSVNELSGGQQQRAAIARAIVHRPALILADEPTGNLDSCAGKCILDLLDSLRAGGTTVVMVTHDAHAAARADRVIRVCDGKIEGKP